MPPTYACPSTPPRDRTLTSYRGFSGNGAFFEADRAVKIAHIIDGTSNTLMVVEAKEGVPWTKPEELPFVPGQPAVPLYGAGSVHPSGFNAAFVDGAVRFIKTTIDPQVLRALITRAGGEVVDASKF